MDRARACQIAAWSLSGVVVLLSVLAWGQTYDWQISFNAYLLFPLFGLLAYGLMWTHYASSSLRMVLHLDRPVLALYFRITSFAVLLLICLHPGLLIYQRFRDGYGLPPGSYEHYVAPSLSWLTLLGSVSLLVFLAYELRRWYGQRAWWKYVVAAGDLAMVAIFYHGLRLGSQLQTGWFRYIWWLYGLSLIVFLIHKYYVKFQSRTLKESAS